jgi:hypothetical protein
VRVTHPVLERPEDMFDGASAYRHCLGRFVELTLNTFQYRLVLPSGDSPICTWCCLSP